MNEDISKALENILKRPFDRQFIRASICFMAVKNSRRDYDLIFTNFFDIQKDAYNKETKYRILLELTLYQFNEWSPVNKEIDDESIDSHSYHLNETIDTKDKICDYLDEYSDEILPKFIDDLYDFLCKNNDSSDLTHINFIDITLQFIEKNSTKFLKAIRKRIPDEKKFRTQLKSYYEQNPNNRKISIKLYASFRVLTSEFLCMIEQFYNDNYDDEYDRLSFEFEQVSDRHAIENLFQLIQSANITDEKFRIYSIIVSSIVRYNQISLSEIHQRIKLVNNDSSDYHREEHILNLLLECSCIDNSYRKTMEIKLVTENDIEQAIEAI
ncbi:hypothetical protein I4U23_011112 [Adineta vaga]|nr:hypothetical protein I4U23_011112 [Adineta vaga]